jgi:hypothetical protein
VGAAWDESYGTSLRNGICGYASYPGQSGTGWKSGGGATRWAMRSSSAIALTVVYPLMAQETTGFWTLRAIMVDAPPYTHLDVQHSRYQSTSGKGAA